MNKHQKTQKQYKKKLNFSQNHISEHNVNNNCIHFVLNDKISLQSHKEYLIKSRVEAELTAAHHACRGLTLCW